MNAEIEKEVAKCVHSLREGGFILFPSELGWSIGCDASDSENVSAILNSSDNLYAALLINDTGKLGKFVKNLPDAVWDLIEFTGKPLHLVIEEVINFPSAAISDMHEITFRVVKDEFTRAVTEKFGKPVFASVLASSTHPSKTDTVLNKNCYVVNLRAAAKASPANLVTMRLLKGGKFEIIRK